MKFSKSYFVLFLILFVIEACIAYFLKTGFIRHTFGDFLVVIMLYCLFKSVFNLKPTFMAIIVLLIAFTVEFLQLTPLLERLNLQDNVYAKLVLGSSFEIMDLVAYGFGIATIMIIELKLKHNHG